MGIGLVAVVALGVFIFFKTRPATMSKDSRRVAELRYVMSKMRVYYEEKGSLPENLSEIITANLASSTLLEDYRGTQYGYERKSSTTYIVSAVFDNNPGNDPMSHYLCSETENRYCYDVSLTTK